MGTPKVSKPIGEAGVRIDVNHCMANLRKVGKKCPKVYGYSGSSENGAQSVDCYQLAIEYPSGMVENFRRLFPFIEIPTFLLIQGMKTERCEDGKCRPRLQFRISNVVLGKPPALIGYANQEAAGDLVSLVSGQRCLENKLVLNPTDPSDELLLKVALKHVIGEICPHINEWELTGNYTPRPEAMKHPEVRGTYEDYLKRTREEE